MSDTLFDTRRGSFGQDVHEVPERGQERKRRGMAKVSANAAPLDRQQLDAAIATLAASLCEFSATEVRNLLPEGWAGHPNLLGSRLAYFHRSGLIRHVGFRKGTLASQHARVLSVWRGA